MKHLIITICLIFSGSIISGQEVNTIIKDTKTDNDILCGETTREGLQKIGGWFDQEYMNYVPDSTIIQSIAAYNTNLPYIFVVLGTWCGDSKEQVPHFFKVVDLIGYPRDKIFMVSVDRDKKAGDFCLVDFDIQLVPTFILTLHDKEIGRIIETPLTTIEQDMLNILKSQASF